MALCPELPCPWDALQLLGTLWLWGRSTELNLPLGPAA